MEIIDNENHFLKKAVLLISNDFKLVLDVKSDFNEKEYFYDIMYINKDDFFLNKFIEHIDVIIFDNVSNDLDLLTMNLIKFRNINLNTPIIVVENNLERVISYYSSTNTYNVVYKPLNTRLLFKSIEICINYIYLNNKITFEGGFHFDINKELLFKDRIIVDLTRMETKLIVFLLKNVNKLVSYEEISKNIWQKKKFTIFSLRNFIKNIRLKTYDTFIKNISNRGYKINSL